jgi:hypothetical protein
MPMLAGDSRSEVDVGLLEDRRARHFWDEERVVGRWLAESGVGEPGYSGVVWDAYYVFGGQASWNERPAPLAGFGSPVIAEKATLEAALRRVLGER